MSVEESYPRRRHRLRPEWAWLSDWGRHRPDGQNCVFLMPDEDVVCAWAGWQHCDHGHQINGENCIIKRASQSIVCQHHNFTGFGGAGCDCAERVRPLDGLFVRLLNPRFPELTPQTDRSFWSQTAVIVMDMGDKTRRGVGAAIQSAGPRDQPVCLSVARFGRSHHPFAERTVGLQYGAGRHQEIRDHRCAAIGTAASA